MTEHIEGDECKFALWTGTVAPISDYKVILRVRICHCRPLHGTVPLITCLLSEPLFSLQAPPLYCPSIFTPLLTVSHCFRTLHWTTISTTCPLTVVSLSLQARPLYCRSYFSSLYSTVPLNPDHSIAHFVLGPFIVLSLLLQALHCTVSLITGPFTWHEAAVGEAPPRTDTRKTSVHLICAQRAS